jgi:hypothetical protein
MSSVGTMARLFLIAVVMVAIVTSRWWVPRVRTRRQTRGAERARRRAELLGAPPPPEPGSLGEALATFEASVDAGDPEIAIVLPARVTIDGREASAAVVDVVLRDAIGRSGYRIVSDTASGPVHTVGGPRRVICRNDGTTAH